MIFSNILGILFLATVCSTAKILLLAPGRSSHLQQVNVIGKQLLKTGRHEISILVPDHMTDSPMLTTKEIRVISYDAGSTAKSLMTKEGKLKFLNVLLHGSMIENVRTFRSFNYEICTPLLSNKDIFDRLNELKFDFAIVNGVPLSRCFYILMHKLEISYATVVTVLSPDVMSSLLNLPSLREPIAVNARISDNYGTFLWRLKNSFLALVISWMYNENRYAAYIPENLRPVTVTELARNSRVWLIDSDSSMDIPQPAMPHVFHVGGLSITESKPLGSSFKSIAEKAVSSLVLVSFGGDLDFIDDNIFNRIYEAIKSLPQFTFIWTTKQRPSESTAENVHLFDWIPQRDILAHNNLILFITHCGNSGQYEALYNAVPMLGIPFFADQASNAVRIYRKGFGRFLDLRTFTTELLVKMVLEMTSNSTYKRNIQKASALYRLKKPAIERAAEVIEHVLEYGSDHLRSPAIELEWYQLLMWDIALFLLIVTIVLTSVMCFCLYQFSKCFCRCLKSSRQMKDKVQ